MNINTYMEKIDTLSECDLRHAIRLVDVEIENYERVSRNYPYDRFKTYAVPRMKKLLEKKERLQDRLDEISD